MNEEIKPFMRKREIKIIEKQLFLLGKQNKKIDILEWGSGGSTVYFSQFLRDNNIQYNWLSIEYNKKWHDKISEIVSQDIDTEVVLFDVGNDNLRQRNLEMNEYVNYPNTLNKKFDFILVDGRKRRRCLLEARSLIKFNGVVFLHDAQRKYYHCALEIYSNSLFVGAYLWKGKTKSISLLNKIFNKVIFLFWRSVSWTDFFLRKGFKGIYYKSSFLQKVIVILRLKE